MVNDSCILRGLGTWFNTEDGSLLYPLIDDAISYYRLPPVDSINGLFSLNEEDVKIYTYTGNLDHVRMLYPNTQSDSAFLKMVDKGIFTDKDINRCMLKIPIKIKKPSWSRFEGMKPILVVVPQQPHIDPSFEIKTKTRVLKHNYGSKDLLTDLIHDFLSTIGIKEGDPKPFGSHQAWGKIINEYKNEAKIILSIETNESKTYTKIILNSADKKEVEIKEFQRRYNDQFIKRP